MSIKKIYIKMLPWLMGTHGLLGLTIGLNIINNHNYRFFYNNSRTSTLFKWTMGGVILGITSPIVYPLIFIKVISKPYK